MLWFEGLTCMVPSPDWLANFKFLIILTIQLAHVLLSLAHFLEMFGVVLPYFVKFFQNYLAFIGSRIPIVIDKVG